MLVKKQRSQRKVITIGVVVVVLILVIYLVYISFWSDGIIGDDLDQLASQAGIKEYEIYGQSMEGLDFVQLEEHGELYYTEQFSYLATDKTSPSKPTNLLVKNPGYGEMVDIFWLAPDDKNYDFFRIYRSQDESKKGQLIVDNLTEAHYRDESVKNDQFYYYTVVSVNQDGQESIDSPQEMGIPRDLYPPTSPTDVKISQADEGRSAVLTWTNPSDGDFSHVKIYRSTSRGQVGSLIKDGLKDNTYKDAGLSSGLVYYYTLTIVDKSGNESSRALSYVNSGRSNPFEVFEF